MADELGEPEVPEEVEAAEGAEGADGVDGADGEGVADAAAPKKKFLSGKKLILIVAPVVLLLGGGAGVYFSGILEDDEKKTEEQMKEEEGPKKAVFHQVPDLLVNLNTGGSTRRNFLKISISLELEKQEDVAWIESVMPRIVDNFQIYLRELRVEDLKGSAGLARLREELLLRVNAAAQPVKVSDVLFRQMLIQ